MAASLPPQCIILVGFMGSGKSSVGRTLAAELGWRFGDLDKLIEKREGRTISEIFEKGGEKAFRNAEMAALQTLFDEPDAQRIVATGGGVALSEKNWAVMRALGPVVYLQTSPEILWKRLRYEVAHRPLLAGSPDPEAKIREMLAIRAPLYEQANDIVNTDRLNPSAVAHSIRDRLGL